jgi:Tfp pilus assembly protein PilX
MIMTRLFRALRNDEGIALAAVVGIGMVLTVLVASMLTLSTSGAIKSGTDRDASNAMAAAYAGLADYQSRITANNAYEGYGVLTSFNTGSYFTGTNSNPAFGTTASGTTASGTWAQVINSGGTESYRYEVDNSQFAASGTLRLRVTGRAGTVTRSLVANLRGTGFINYLYFTDYESQNPAITGEMQTGNGNTSKLCTSQHITDTTYNPNTACKPVQFGTGDVLSGPVRTNDEFTICGSEFKMSVQSTAPNGVYIKPSGCGSAQFDSGTAGIPLPQNVSSFQLPATNGAMLQETRSDLTATTVPRPGCLYTGPTSITFNSSGTMTVISPWTKATQIAIASDGTMSGTAPAACGALSALGSSAGATITVPPSNLVYVQTVPGSNTNSDPNYWPTSGALSQPTSPTSAALCTKTVTVSGHTTTTYGNGLTNAATGLTYPATNEYAGPAGPQTAYGCRNGDVFVQGQFHGALTVGAQNNVYVTGPLKYTNASTDILGLVGQTSVTVWNPMSCTSFNYNGVCTSGSLLARSGGADLEIDAAIASNGGTFQVQNYNFGSALGTLTVMGSIAQKFRGAVATTSNNRIVTGFTKNYGYDARLQNTAPPKFLQPVATTYGVTTEIAVKSAYSADGTPTP